MEPCPSQALIRDLACDPQQHLRSQEKVNVYLCLTCGSPVFRDDDEQDSDLTSSFCLDCFSMFDRSHDDIDLHDDDDDTSMTDMDDNSDDDCEVSNGFHASHHADSISFHGHDLPSSLGFSFLTGGSATTRAAESRALACFGQKPLC